MQVPLNRRERYVHNRGIELCHEGSENYDGYDSPSLGVKFFGERSRPAWRHDARRSQFTAPAQKSRHRS